MNLRRFPILLTSTVIVAATALLAPADGAEQRSFWGFFAPHVEVDFSVGHTCPPPAPVCAQPVYAPPVREVVWVEGFSTYDAYGCRQWVPGHYEERFHAQPRPPECRYPEPPRHPEQRFPEHRPAPPAHGGPGHHDDERGPGHHDDRGPGYHR